MWKSCKVFQAHLFTATGGQMTPHTFFILIFLVFCFKKKKVTSFLIMIVELKPTLNKLSHTHATSERKIGNKSISNIISLGGQCWHAYN